MSTSGPPVSAGLEAKARHLVDRAAQGDFEGASRDFGAVMRGALPPEKLAETWTMLVSQVGSLQTVESVEIKAEGGLSICLATARFEKAEIVIRVVLDAQEEVVGLFFAPKPRAVEWNAPAYADPAVFDERAVQVGGAPALPGVLSVPKGEGPFPAVVLVHGSGPNDQDETVGGIKVFKDLAWGLASKGIVVLRYVKRTRHSPAGVVTQKEEVEDAAVAAIDLLVHTPGVDPNEVFLLGHSQGGYLAPRIAQKAPALAGIVILAGSTRSLQDSMLEQLTYFSTLDPDNAAVLSVLEASRKFKETVEDPGLAADQKVDLPTGGTITGAYFLDVRGYDGPAMARALSCKILVLQGERDYQVTMKDFEGWKAALSSSPDAVLKVYPNLNHLFCRGEGTPSPAEYEAPGHVDEAVIADIAAFLTAP